jgi:hypothetical protein
MRGLGMILDVTHLAEESFWEALEVFDGPVMASHNNCRALCDGERQFRDEQIKALIARDASIGVAFDAWMLHPDWCEDPKRPNPARLSQVVDNYRPHLPVGGRHLTCGDRERPGRGYGGSRVRRTWTRSPICKSCRGCSPNGGIRRATSPT